ncbi:hypothetical protein QYF61_025273 [Mycteria americana]|uniref:Reverse transcriptase domain-containing protein n=1 Tax=Mycteria americana TaxID=33587 RepID=A0AAN7S5F0_MYCAM|nr:hypothetical protein QYF61_025273 [Mycteria americana]
MPVTGRNQSRSHHGRSRVSPKRNGDPIGKRCRRPSSAVGEPIGRSPLFRLLPDQPEESRSGRANQGARCLCHTAPGRFQAAARGGERARAAIGFPGGALRLARGDEAARKRNPALRDGPISKPGAAGSARSRWGTAAHLYDLTGRAGSWQSGEVPETWKKANVTPIFRKGKKKDVGNYSPVSVTSIPEKVMEKEIMETISRHMKNKKVVGCSQHGFIKGKSGLTNLTAFHSEMTGLMNERRVVDIFCLDFSKVFDTVSRNIPIDKLTKYRLDKWTVRWIK